MFDTASINVNNIDAAVVKIHQQTMAESLIEQLQKDKVLKIQMPDGEYYRFTITHMRHDGRYVFVSLTRPNLDVQFEARIDPLNAEKVDVAIYRES